MSRKIVIPHALLKTGHDCTVETEERMKAEGLNLHVHEVECMDDDYRKGERVLHVKNTKYVFMGGK